MAIKAIETRYAGCHFRSRLEARWAVFFDALGVEWQYEPERFPLDRGSYLPDFCLPDGKGNVTWVEVKGELNRLDWDYITRICDYDSPLPGMKDSLGTARGLLVLGPIPRVEQGRGWNHALIQHNKGLHTAHALFHGRHNGDIPMDPGVSAFSGSRAYRVEKGVIVGEVEVSCPELLPGCQWRDFSCEGVPPIDILSGHLNYGWGNTELSDAYEKARSARFEHGRSG